MEKDPGAIGKVSDYLETVLEFQPVSDVYVDASHDPCAEQLRVIDAKLTNRHLRRIIETARRECESDPIACALLDDKLETWPKY